jgi:hypothetical protein
MRNQVAMALSHEERLPNLRLSVGNLAWISNAQSKFFLKKTLKMKLNN